jgi:hypothetical protein
LRACICAALVAHRHYVYVCAGAVITGAFDGNYVARITSNMRARAPHMALASVVYQVGYPQVSIIPRGEHLHHVSHKSADRVYSNTMHLLPTSNHHRRKLEGGASIRHANSQRGAAPISIQAFDAFPDLALMLDAPVFFFRNLMEGAQTCAPASCPWGPHATSHTSHYCLAGVCSEPTTFNAPLEIARVVAGLPASRSIIASYYATGHSAGGQPSARYMSRVLQTLAAQDRVAGVMTYCAKAALQPCAGAPLFGHQAAPAGQEGLGLVADRREGEGGGGGDDLQHQLGCIVRRAYGAMVAAGGA